MRVRAQAAQNRVRQLEAQEEQLQDQLDAGRTYQSEEAFRAALNARIRQAARSCGLDHTEIARRFALQQFTSRLFACDPESWLVTGGTALQFRSNEARPTADLDLAATRELDQLQGLLMKAARRRAGEHGDFVVSLASTGGGAFTGRITYLLNGARFAVAKLDIATHRRFPFPPEILRPAPVLRIDDTLPMPAVRTYAVASHLADKVAAMYELHGDNGVAPSTRSHDLVDILVLSRCSEVGAQELRAAIDGEQRRRGVSIPSPLVLPADLWRSSYPSRVAQAGLPVELHNADTAISEANRFVGAVVSGRVREGRWSPERREWIRASA